jgi:hypothetical protein
MALTAALCFAVAATNGSGTTAAKAAPSTLPYSQHAHFTCRAGFRCKVIRLHGCTLRGKVVPTWRKIANLQRCSYTFSFLFFAEYNGKMVLIVAHTLRCSARSVWPKRYRVTIDCPPKVHNQISPAVASTIVTITVFKLTNGDNYFFSIVPVVNARGQLIHRFIGGSGCPPKLCG